MDDPSHPLGSRRGAEAHGVCEARVMWLASISWLGRPARALRRSRSGQNLGRDAQATGRAVLICTLIVVAMMSSVVRADGTWTQLPPLPDREGFAGAFAGVTGGALIVAGGANFPD